ncbi:LAGLIDADG family homing endonuclease [Candidatus Daviesbacteria bacterium]|nr:LAGLIDADG family homing endonuclease [Candidatus Daviesbacteria bacterium]
MANNGEALLILGLVWFYAKFITKKSMGNTVGRLSKISAENLAYIAGFLDGDGSIMLQLHRRNSGKEVFRVKTVICFYQDSKHLKEIKWIQKTLDCGYVYTRNDHICELRVEGFTKVLEILQLLKPYLRFKKKQANLMLNVIPKLQQKLINKQEIVIWIEKMRSYNYFSSQRNILEVPVTTYMEGTR